MDGEAARALEPSLVARARERLQEREAVAGRAVAEAVTLLVAVGTRLPRELGPCEEQLFVQVVGGRGDYPRGALAPLTADLQERMDVAGEAVHRSEEAVCLPMQALRPEPVLVTAGEQRLRTLASHLGPAFLPGPRVEGVRREHRPGSTP